MTRFLRRVAAGLLEVFQRQRREGELDEELRHFLECSIDRKVQDGVDRETAIRAARLEMGSTAAVKEQVRDVGWETALADLWRDARYAARMLYRSPGLTAVTVLTLGLGIGVPASIFAVVDAVLLRPLPYPRPLELVRIVERVPANEHPEGLVEERTVMDKDEFLAWRRQSQTLAAMAAYVTQHITVTTATDTVRVSAAFVSPDLFSLLGVTARTGRSLDPRDESASATSVVISAATSERYFGEDSSALGRTIVLNGRVHTIVGVMPARFDFPTSQTDLWMPYSISPPQEGRTTFVDVIARMKSGVSLEQATAEANIIGNGIRAHVDGRAARLNVDRFEVRRMRDQLLAPFTPAIRVLIIAAAVVFLIVSANVGCLLLARAAARRVEMGIRLALGVSGGRLFRQLLAESLVLVAIGCCAGIVVALVGVEVIKALGRVDLPDLFRLAETARTGASDTILPRLEHAAVDVRMLAFAVLAAAMLGVGFGLAPLWQVRHFTSRSRGFGLGHAVAGAGSYRGGRLRVFLLAGQIVLATALLVAATLLVRSFVTLVHIPTGYEPSGVLTFQLVLPPEYAAGQKLQMAEALTGRLRSLPQVTATGFTNLPPLAGGVLHLGVFLPPGRTLAQMMADPERPQARCVGGDYLRALGVRLLEGRWLEQGNTREGSLALLITRSTARRYFPDGRAVGAEVTLAPGQYSWRIVGVVDDVLQGRLDTRPYPQFFVNPQQAMNAIPEVPAPLRADFALGFLSFAMRVTGEPAASSAQVRTLVRELDASAAVDSVATMNELLSGSVGRPRFYATVVGAFALLCASLAIVGVYGVLAYSVNQRTRELGIRKALGATSGDIIGLIVREGSMLALMSIAVGLFAAALTSRVLRGMLFGVEPGDPATYMAVGMLFTVVSVLAVYVPARRAAGVDPLIALRCE